MVRIRIAELGDASQIVQIRKKAFLTPLSKWLETNPELHLLEAQRSQYKALIEPGQRNHVALDEEGQIVGYCSYCIKGTCIESTQAASILHRLEAQMLSLQLLLWNIVFYTTHLAQWKERTKRFNLFGQELEIDLKKTAEIAGTNTFIYLKTLVIDPDVQQGGIGSKLLHLPMEEAQERDVPLLLESNAPAVSFYKKKGFQEIGKSFDFYRDGQLLGTMPNFIWIPKSSSTLTE